MNPLQKVLIYTVIVYQRTLSPDQGYIKKFYPFAPVCTMYPSCSEYMKGSIQKHGAILGVLRGTARVLRCRPGQKHLIDHP